MGWIFGRNMAGGGGGGGSNMEIPGRNKQRVIPKSGSELYLNMNGVGTIK